MGNMGMVYGMEVVLVAIMHRDCKFSCLQGKHILLTTPPLPFWYYL